MEIGRVFRTVFGFIWNWWLVDVTHLHGFPFFLSFFLLLLLFSFQSQFKISHEEGSRLTRGCVAWCENSPPHIPCFFFFFFSLLQVFHDLNGISWAWSRLWKEQTWYMGTASITVRSSSPLLRARTKKKKKKSIVILEYESNRSELRAEKQNSDFLAWAQLPGGVTQHRHAASCNL